jgi:hypothetical protein
MLDLGQCPRWFRRLRLAALLGVFLRKRAGPVQ